MKTRITTKTSTIKLDLDLYSRVIEARQTYFHRGSKLSHVIQRVNQSFTRKFLEQL